MRVSERSQSTLRYVGWLLARQLASHGLHQFLLPRESLKYVGRLEIDICYRRWPKTIGEHESMLPTRCDDAVKRWCDIASRRLRHVRVVRECGGCNTFNPVQTKRIVDCAASFPNLQEFDIHAGEAVAT